MTKFGLTFIGVIFVAAVLSGCGKKGAPHAPPSEGEPIYPRVYPTE